MKVTLLTMLALASIGITLLYARDPDLTGQCGKVERIKDKLKKHGQLVVTLSESSSFSIVHGNYRLSKNESGRGDKQDYSITPTFLLADEDIRDAKLLIYKNTMTDLLKIAQATSTFACVTHSYDLYLIKNGIEYTVGIGDTAEKAALNAEEILKDKLKQSIDGPQSQKKTKDSNSSSSHDPKVSDASKKDIKESSGGIENTKKKNPGANPVH